MTDTPMTKDEFAKAVYFAVLLTSDFMPVLKGRGKLERPAREGAIKAYAERLTEHLLRSNLKPYIGPPAPPHTAPR